MTTNSRPKGMTAKRRMTRSLVAAAALALCVGGVVLWVRPWADYVMTVRVRVTTDEEGPVEMHRTRVGFGGWGRPRPVREAEIDLGRWEGELVRVDIEGEVVERGSSGARAGYVGCWAELSGASGTVPIEFVGWQNDDKKGMHPGTVGCPAFIVERGETSLSAFSPEGALWHVMKVPEDSALRLAMTPVSAREAAGELKPTTPAVRTAGRRPIRSSRPKEERPLDVYIYLIDALRADHLGCYGYERPTSPVIDAFATEGVLFENAYTTAPWTHPAVP